MRLSLQGVIPTPLREKVETYKSGIWKNTAELEQGNYVFVQAPSGTGKTTLIHILYGLRKDYSGEVRWDNTSMRTAGDEQLAQLRTNDVSVIFQDMRLFPELTAWENIEIKRKLTDTITEQQAAEWMQRLGIAEKKNSLAATLSYGEQQRVAIIRALLQPFNWLLMDEPFSHLDHGNINKAIALISDVVKQNGGSILLADLDANTYFPYTQSIIL